MLCTCGFIIHALLAAHTHSKALVSFDLGETVEILDFDDVIKSNVI